jgi:hypothetical protein
VVNLFVQKEAGRTKSRPYEGKLRADEQKHHMRRRLEASWYKTAKPCDLTATVNDAVARPSAATKCPWGTGTVHVLIWGGTTSRDLLNRRSVENQ